MSLTIYSTPRSTIFSRPPVIRQYVPGRVTRQLRYERSLSAPLGLDKEFTYNPWEGSRRDFTTSLLETKPRGYTNSILEIKQRNYINSHLPENGRRDFVRSPLAINTVSLAENKQRDLFNSPLQIKHREILIPISESKRIDFSNNRLQNRRSELTSGYLESRRNDYTNNHLEDSRRDFKTNHLENNRKDLINSHFENKRTDVEKNQSDNNKRDLLNGCLENKERNVSSSKPKETGSRTLPSARRAIRWWNKEKNLCTPEDLLEIIREPTGHYELPTDPCNEVYPGIILSDGPTALCTSMLKRMGVSHVLNAAQGKERPGQVNTSPSFYSHSRIRYLGVEAFDHIAFRLYPYFDEASDFVEDALDSGGKVLVHCRAGISRSATLVCAFLMLRRNLSAQEAVRAVRKNRPIIPNDGFLQQLCDLNERLHKTRGP